MPVISFSDATPPTVVANGGRDNELFCSTPAHSKKSQMAKHSSPGAVPLRTNLALPPDEAATLKAPSAPMTNGEKPIAASANAPPNIESSSQYSSGSKQVVSLRSCSVMIHSGSFFAPSL